MPVSQEWLADFVLEAPVCVVELLMREKSLLVTLVLSVFPCGTIAQTHSVSATIHPSLPTFKFIVHERERAGLAEGARVIDSIAVWSGEKHLQTIQFPDENAPVVFGPERSITIEDVDCDGFKDLLVRLSVGVHGGSWYDLFRFDPAQKKFVAYPRFSELPLKSVDCRNKLIKTYVNSGSAGCVYEAGIYHWEKGELVPVRIEVQDPAENGSSFIRTIRSRNDKKETVSRRQIPVQDCHAQ